MIEELSQKSKEELIKGYLVEMNAKNTAYFFILENGLFESFKLYFYGEPAHSDN